MHNEITCEHSASVEVRFKIGVNLLQYKSMYVVIKLYQSNQIHKNKKVASQFLHTVLYASQSLLTKV